MVMHQIEEYQRLWSETETEWAEVGETPKAVQIEQYIQNERLKLTLCHKEYNSDPAYYWSLKTFFEPMSAAKAQQAETDYYLVQAYEVAGHEALSGAGMGLLQKIRFICGQKRRKLFTL
jgi:hypothetical protein